MRVAVAALAAVGHARRRCALLRRRRPVRQFGSGEAQPAGFVVIQIVGLRSASSCASKASTTRVRRYGRKGLARPEPGGRASRPAAASARCVGAVSQAQQKQIPQGHGRVCPRSPPATRNSQTILPSADRIRRSLGLRSAGAVRPAPPRARLEPSPRPPHWRSGRDRSCPMQALAAAESSRQPGPT